MDKDIQFTTLDGVYNAVDAFYRETGTRPKRIHLTRNEIDCLNREARASLVGECGHIPNEYIYGLLIVRSETGGHLAG